MKGYNSVITRWKGCMGKVCGKGREVMCGLAQPLSLGLLVFTNSKAQLVVDKLKYYCTERRKHCR